jgi:HSP20 family molecular chaperone IbpA
MFVNFEQAKAEFKNGVLKIILPRAAKPEKQRTIPVTG